jgi:hypothetical protein
MAEAEAMAVYDKAMAGPQAVRNKAEAVFDHVTKVYEKAEIAFQRKAMAVFRNAKDDKGKPLTEAEAWAVYKKTKAEAEAEAAYKKPGEVSDSVCDNTIAEAAYKQPREERDAVCDNAIDEAWAVYKKAMAEAEIVRDNAMDETWAVYKKTTAEVTAAWNKAKAEKNKGK